MKSALEVLLNIGSREIPYLAVAAVALEQNGRDYRNSSVLASNVSRGGRTGNMPGWYSSRKMQLSIQFEN